MGWLFRLTYRSPNSIFQSNIILSCRMASSAITDLEKQLAEEMGFPPDISKKAALICGEITDPEQRLIAAINFIETDIQENIMTVQEMHDNSNQILHEPGLSLGKPIKMTVCVRKDIAMSPGKMASQVAHACLQLATNLDSNSKRRSFVREWQEQSNEKIVVLECHSLDAMKSMQSKAAELGVFTAPIADAGRTEIEPGTITCMAVGPGYENIIDKVTGHLKLYS